MQKLLQEFGSLERVKAATDDELIKLIGPAAARKVRAFYESGPALR